VKALRDALLALVAFAAQLGLLAHGGLDSSHYHGLDVRGGVLAAVSALPLAFWRRGPLAAFVLTTVASSMLNLLDYPPGPPVGATIALFLFAATNAGATRRTVALVAALLAAHVASVGIGHSTFPTTPLLFGLLVWTLTLVAGDRVRLHRERIERGRRLAAAEERTRIARDLHDSVGHAINVILVQAGAARLLRERDPARSGAAIETIEDVARQTVGEIDALVRTLREDVGENGRVEAQPGLAALDMLVAQHRLAGLTVRVDRSGDPQTLSATTDQAAYRILQEALTNAARHGSGSADVAVHYRDRGLELTVRNSIAPRATHVEGGHGLIGMHERATLLGGSLTARATGGTFIVHAVLPVRGRDHG
jgi:signal transduction histidine kinase